MGGAVSSGESNDELIDNLMNAAYIKNPAVERVFRAVDRALYYTASNKKNAYKDLAWKDGNLHLSAPCIYSEVMENLDLGPGMSFLNMGSGTGYLSTMCGLIIGRNGMNHGIELHADVTEYAREKLEEFFQSSAAIDLFDFCRPEFVVGNCLDPISAPQRYDRIYCGAACPEEYIRSITDLLKVGGICIIPINDSLVKVTRLSEDKVDKKTLLPVSFATLVHPRSGEIRKPVILPDWNPPSLKELCRSEIRNILRKSIAATDDRPLGEERKKKKRKRRQERRRASRLLVVQRRRSGAEGGETGFVAVAYSLGNNSSDDEYLPQGAAHSITSDSSDTDSDDEVHHGRLDSLDVAHQQRQRDEEMDSLPTPETTGNDPVALGNQPSSSTSSVSQENEQASESSPSKQPRSSSTVGAGAISNETARAASTSGGLRAVRQRVLNSRGTRNPSRPTGSGSSYIEMGLFGRIREQYRRARRERDLAEGRSILRQFVSTNLDNFAASARNASRQLVANASQTLNNVQMDVEGVLRNPNPSGIVETPPGSSVEAAPDSTNPDIGAGPSSDPPIEENDGEISTTRPAGHEGSWSTESSLESSLSTTDDEEEKGEEDSAHLQPGLVGGRGNSNRTSGSTESGVVVSDTEENKNPNESKTENNCNSKENENCENAHDENASTLMKNHYTFKMMEKIDELPVAPSLKNYLNYHRKMQQKSL